LQDLFGLLFSLPTESVAVRATIGSLVGVVLTTALLTTVLRVPRVRSAAVLVPMGAVIGAIVASWGSLQLPTIMTTSEAEHAYGPFLIRDTYVHFAPMAAPLLALWAAVASARLGSRLAAMRRMRLVALSGAPPRDTRMSAIVERVARDLGVTPPRITVIRDCPGGAALVGVHSPTIVMDADILSALDDDELEGLLAHELAHMRRRDNLVSLVVGFVRDVCWFVPGGKWVSRRLCVEREVAADEAAVSVTTRPGALASGLLKAIDVHRPSLACAAFSSSAAVVGRVERLVCDRSDGGRCRTLVESTLVAGSLTVAIALGVQIPGLVASNATEDGFGRSALALLWTWSAESEVTLYTEATAFDVYRRSTPYQPTARVTGAGPVDAGVEFHPAVLRGERPLQAAAQVEVHTTMDPWVESERERWRATRVVAANDGLGVYWLHDPRK
jgi:beta-lactamase regulating signal transducer with metallopeptidase domain